MKNVLKSAFFGTVLGFFSSGVWAAEAIQHEWNEVPVKIIDLTQEMESAGERAYVVFSEQIGHKTCDGSGIYRVYPNTGKGKILMDMLRSAILAGTPVNAAVLTNGKKCDDWNRPVLSGLKLYPPQ